MTSLPLVIIELLDIKWSLLALSCEVESSSHLTSPESCLLWWPSMMTSNWVEPWIQPKADQCVVEKRSDFWWCDWIGFGLSRGYPSLSSVYSTPCCRWLLGSLRCRQVLTTRASVQVIGIGSEASSSMSIKPSLPLPLEAEEVRNALQQMKGWLYDPLLTTRTPSPDSVRNQSLRSVRWSSNLWLVRFVFRCREDEELSRSRVMALRIRCRTRAPISGHCFAFHLPNTPSRHDYSLHVWDQTSLTRRQLWDRSSLQLYRLVFSPNSSLISLSRLEVIADLYSDLIPPPFESCLWSRRCHESNRKPVNEFLERDRSFVHLISSDGKSLLKVNRLSN